ncbi:hypothetical protein [Nocardia abscessus]|nr:hypothetical protein [Nocardia abscessus]
MSARRFRVRGAAPPSSARTGAQRQPPVRRLLGQKQRDLLGVTA